MIDGSRPFDRRHREPLVVRNRNQREPAKGCVHPPQLWNVELSVHGRNRSSCETHSQRIVENVNVKMQDVKLLRHPTDLVEHDEMVRNRISYVGVKTKCLFTADLKSSGGDRVAAGEESHVVALADEFFGEIGDDPLSSSVQLGWAALHQRCYLRDLH